MIIRDMPVFTPPEFDDGFTQRHGRFLYRPMLWRQRDDLKAAVKDGRGALYQVLRPPWILGTFDQIKSDQDHSSVDEERSLILKILGYSSAQEAADYCELRDGISFFHENPGMACVSCDVCHEIIIDIDRGVPYIPTGGSSPVPRPSKVNVPCDSGRSCPKGHWSKPKGFSKLCESVWRHYWMMKAAGKQAPDCPIIHRNWALIDWVISGKRANLNPMAVGSARRSP
jgi:hypothetical protein